MGHFKWSYMILGFVFFHDHIWSNNQHCLPNIALCMKFHPHLTFLLWERCGSLRLALHQWVEWFTCGHASCFPGRLNIFAICMGMPVTWYYEHCTPPFKNVPQVDISFYSKYWKNICFLKDKTCMLMGDTWESTKKSKLYEKITVDMRMFHNNLFSKYFEIFSAVQL